jgi:hypothetical protein
MEVIETKPIALLLRPYVLTIVIILYDPNVTIRVFTANVILEDCSPY